MESVTGMAEEFVIVSPFFSIDTHTGNLLNPVRRLEILVGDEFSTNNPRPLKALSERAGRDVKCLYAEQFGRRLHAKVFLATGPSGRRRALVGSANFTVSGLTSNEEQAVSFDSDCEADRPILDEIRQWIDDLQDAATDIDWNRANLEFEHSPNPSFPARDFDTYLRNQALNFWVLKTTEGAEGISRWDEFVEERVISVGWTDIVEIMRDDFGLEPDAYTRPDLNAAAVQWVEHEGGGGSPMHAAKTLDWFCNRFSRGDRIILCRGYADAQQADVHLYGLAVVDGDAYDDTASRWWRLKRRAVFRRMETDIPKQVFVDTLGRASLLQTVHHISEEEYERFWRRCREF
ncbi:MAG: phospholipase D family protein [Rhodospirillaceae bacterium]|nr:phospholipase D family protein [Rhodospirillaceae bacterium]